jgi:hypothetical protein
LSLLVTAGQRGGSPLFEAVLDGIRVAWIGPGRARGAPDRVLSDKAYSSRVRPGDLQATPRDRVPYQNRLNTTEPSPPATTNLVVRYEAVLVIASINEWLRHLNTP